MKKARIFLSAIAVVAIVSGALAFKTSTFAQRDVFCPLPGAPDKNECPLQNARKNGVVPIAIPQACVDQQLSIAYTATTTTTREVSPGVTSTFTICEPTATTATVFATVNQ